MKKRHLTADFEKVYIIKKNYTCINTAVANFKWVLNSDWANEDIWGESYYKSDIQFTWKSISVPSRVSWAFLSMKMVMPSLKNIFYVYKFISTAVNYFWVVVILWLGCLPSTLTLQVQILLKKTFFSVKLVEKNKKWKGVSLAYIKKVLT